MHTSWVRNLAVTAIVAVAIGWFVLSARQQSGFVVPPIDGYMEGQKIRFIHTEASDPKVAELLTQMRHRFCVAPMMDWNESANLSNGCVVACAKRVQ